MQEFFNDIPLLVEVARQKSFVRAAEILEIGASTLSRRIKQLEQRMGVLLLYRDTRNVELTASGAFLLDRCEFILTEARKAHDAVVMNRRTPAGLIRVCMFRDLYNKGMSDALTRFAKKWPDIRLNLTFAEHPVDMRTDPYDIAFLLRSYIAPPLIARKLMTIQPYLFASPALFERHPRPTEPEDLHKLPCIILERFGNRWTMNDGKRHATLEIQPRYTFSSVETCHDFALAGLGVTMLRGTRATMDEQAGKLVKVLPEWSGGFKHDVYLVTGPGEIPNRLQLFIDHILKADTSF